MTTKRMGEEQFRWFHGVVEDNNDPEKLGRVKVRVTNDHDDPSIVANDLPWATIINLPTSASANQVGRSPTGLLPGSHVFGFFMDGHEKQLPLIWGSLAKLPDGTQGTNDVPALAREINSITINSVGPEPATAYSAKYPYNHVTQTQSGHVIELDDTPSNERLRVYHKAGTYIEVNKDGRLVVKSANDAFNVVVGNNTVYVSGSVNVQILGTANVNISGAATMKAASWNITGDVTLNGKLTATGDVIGNGISLDNHTHPDPQGGNTGKPQ